VRVVLCDFTCQGGKIVILLGGVVVVFDILMITTHVHDLNKLLCARQHVAAERQVAKGKGDMVCSLSCLTCFA
jgi:hypothetical protein